MRRPDGRLSLDPGGDDPAPRDECGVFGVWAPGEEVARLTYFGLYALQHRGQESAGIATCDGHTILVYKDMGLVSQVFDDQALSSLPGHMAIGHVRYATTGASTWENAQPMLGPTASGTVAVAHNGNLTNTAQLADEVRRKYGADLRGEFGRGSSTDTAVMTALLRGADRAHDEADGADGATGGDGPGEAGEAGEGARESLQGVAQRILPRLHGAFSIVFMDENTLYAARDKHGLRPLVIGRLPGGWAIASETAALDIVGASFAREVEPGELVMVDEGGLRSVRFAEPEPAGCIFEYVYLARPDTRIAGTSVMAARRAMGQALAREYPADADLVIATPDSGTPAAIGYAQAAGIPFAQGLVKNAYVGRTFIQPTQTIRQLGIRLKLNPVREVIEGKRLVVVDDSIVRGNTQRALVRMLREAGAAEVHVRISSPPVKWPCFYGIDFATRAELIANGLTVEQICQNIGADSLGFINLEAMVEATQIAENKLCTACFTGRYPASTPQDFVRKDAHE
nr:amidophosphoribosyltransferase [Bowdeniella nasicola]